MGSWRRALRPASAEAGALGMGTLGAGAGACRLDTTTSSSGDSTASSSGLSPRRVKERACSRVEVVEEVSSSGRASGSSGRKGGD